MLHPHHHHDLPLLLLSLTCRKQATWETPPTLNGVRVPKGHTAETVELSQVQILKTKHFRDPKSEQLVPELTPTSTPDPLTLP